VARTYGWRGAAKAIGWDLLRAPANVVLSGATGVARLGGLAARSVGARRIGDRLGRFQILLETDVGREVVWRVHSDFMMIPYRQVGRANLADALFERFCLIPGSVATLIR
jgi:hypothetical protein